MFYLASIIYHNLVKFSYHLSFCCLNGLLEFAFNMCFFPTAFTRIRAI